MTDAVVFERARVVLPDGVERVSVRIEGGLITGIDTARDGARPVDASGRCTVISYGRPVAVSGVNVRPGDIVFAEIDGIVIVPRDIAEETVERAFAKVAKEDGARADLEQLRGLVLGHDQRVVLQ